MFIIEVIVRSDDVLIYIILTDVSNFIYKGGRMLVKPMNNMRFTTTPSLTITST